MLQQIAWIISAFFLLMVIAVFAFVVKNAKGQQEYDPIVKKAYRIRTIYFYGLLIFLVAAFIFTLSKTPYGAPATVGGNNAVKVDVTGYQFYWKFSQNTVPVGQPIEFDVTSKDVNHGFGIYDQNMTMVAQVQAMPDYTNKLYYTFTKPGTYQVLCLEYCGIGHHAMIGKITVEGNGGAANATK